MQLAKQTLALCCNCIEKKKVSNVILSAFSKVLFADGRPVMIEQP